MRNRVQPIVGLLVVVSGLVVAGAPVRVTTDRDPKADFSQLATYRWLPTPPYLTPHDARDPGLVQEALDEPIRAAVDRALGDKRFKRAASTKQPDFHVLYYAAFSTGMDANVLGAYYGYLTGWGSPVLATPGPPPRLDEGTLVIDILRAIAPSPSGEAPPPAPSIERERNKSGGAPSIPPSRRCSRRFRTAGKSRP